MKQQTDEQLMQEVAEGNLDMLRFLFERHHVYLYNFLHKMSGDAVLSEDITQDVFYKIIKYRSSYKNGKFVSWMFTIARNSLTTHYARDKNKHSDLEVVAHKLTEESVLENEDHSHLHKALHALEASDREVLILNRFQEIKYDELAEIIGSTPGAVKTKVSRALKKLKGIYFKNI